jgi:hypothetical protein
MTDEQPRSLGEALAAGTEEAVEADELAVDVDGQLREDEAHHRHPDGDVDHDVVDVADLDEELDPDVLRQRADDLQRLLVGDVHEHEAEQDDDVPADAPADVVDDLAQGSVQGYPATMQGLKALLHDPEFAAANSVSRQEEFGPLIEYGNRMIPLSLLRMMQRGVIRGFQ